MFRCAAVWKGDKTSGWQAVVIYAHLASSRNPKASKAQVEIVEILSDGLTKNTEKHPSQRLRLPTLRPSTSRMILDFGSQTKHCQWRDDAVIVRTKWSFMLIDDIAVCFFSLTFQWFCCAIFISRICFYLLGAQSKVSVYGFSLRMGFHQWHCLICFFFDLWILNALTSVDFVIAIQITLSILVLTFFFIMPNHYFSKTLIDHFFFKILTIFLFCK